MISISVKNLHSYYGPIEALKGVDINVSDRGITCLIGSNGAGKTTLLNSISGMVKHSGTIVVNEKDEIINKKSQAIAKMGIIHVPEGRHVFPGLSVEENLETGTINWHGFFGRKPYNDLMEEVFTLFPRLKERREQKAWSLSGGEQQMLAIGRAMMAKPKVLMLDEPSMGLAPVVVDELFAKIIEINKQGLPILLIEQNARLALKISNYAYVIDNGLIAMEGKASELRNDPKVKQAYLGRYASD